MSLVYERLFWNNPYTLRDNPRAWMEWVAQTLQTQDFVCEDTADALEAQRKRNIRLRKRIRYMRNKHKRLSIRYKKLCKEHTNLKLDLHASEISTAILLGEKKFVLPPGKISCT